MLVRVVHDAEMHRVLLVLVSFQATVALLLLLRRGRGAAVWASLGGFVVAAADVS